MIVELYNETTFSFDDITDEFPALELDVEVNVVETHVADYSGASFEISGENVTIENGMYIRFRDGSNQIYSGYVSNLIHDTKRNRYSFDLKSEIDRLKSFYIDDVPAPEGTTIEEKLINALKAIQTFIRYEHFDTYTLGVMPGASNGWEQVGTETYFLTNNDAVNKSFVFYVSGITTPPAAYDVYTNNGSSFYIYGIYLTGGAGYLIGTLVGSNYPDLSGTLTRSSGSGDSTISFSKQELLKWGPIQIYSNRTSENYTEIVNRFDDIENGVVIWEHSFRFYSDSGSAESWQVKIGNGNVGSMNLAAYYTVNSSDQLLHHNGSGGTSAVSGSPTIMRYGWNVLRVELDIEAQTMNTWLNGVQVDTDYDFEDSCSFLDMVHYRCQFSGFTSPSNYYIDRHIIGHRGFLDEYTVVAMDSIAQALLDLDNGDYSGIDDVIYPGNAVTGTDSNDYYAFAEHQSEIYNQPITGNAFEAYFKRTDITGGGWQENTNYGRGTFNDLLADCLLLMNGWALQQYVICNVVNHEIRFYGFLETWTPTALTESLIDEFEQDKTGELILKQMNVDDLRGSGSVTHPLDYTYKVQKNEHKLRYADILDFMEFRSYSGIRGVITAMSIKKSIHEYILTELEGIGVL